MYLINLLKLTNSNFHFLINLSSPENYKIVFFTGATLDKAAVSVGSSVFAVGMAYVMLSRVRSLAGLYIIKLDERKLINQPKRMGPCNIKALKEVTRLTLAGEWGLNQDMEEQKLDELINFAVEIPYCSVCTLWLCECKCNK